MLPMECYRRSGWAKNTSRWVLGRHMMPRSTGRVGQENPPDTTRPAGTQGAMVRRTNLQALACAAVMTVAVAGCGSSNDDTASTSSASTAASTSTSAAAPAAGGVDAALAAQVPADIKSKGTITVGTDPTYAPSEFTGDDGKTIVGFDPDLGKALGDVLGIKLKFVKSSFDAILPGMQSGKYDLGMSSFTDTKEREAQFDFVTYFNAGSSFFVKAQGGPAITKLTDLCGHKVAVEKGTTQQDDATAQAKKCGGSKLDVQVYPDQNGANQALISGRADVGIADSPVAEYQVKQANGQFKLSGDAYGTAPYGIALPKGSKLGPALLGAVKKIQADGTYQTVLKKWGVDSGALANPAINAATS
jgi:polar amino acid transport system substrate-binding protein